MATDVMSSHLGSAGFSKREQEIGISSAGFSNRIRIWIRPGGEQCKVQIPIWIRFRILRCAREGGALQDLDPDPDWDPALRTGFRTEWTGRNFDTPVQNGADWE